MAHQSFLAKIVSMRRKSNDDNTDEATDRATVTSGRVGVHAKGEEEQGWIDEPYEGQLSVDVYYTADDIVIKSTIAGVEAQDLDITISHDMITIRGTRHQEEDIQKEQYLYRECYFGSFSRSIILPQEVEANKSTAEFKNGILTIRLPKAHREHTVKLKVQEE